MDLVRQVLDKQLVDRKGMKFGKVDGLVVALRPGQPPKMLRVEIGFSVLARRVGPRSAGLISYLRKKLFNGATDRPGRIPWSRIKTVGKDVLCDIRVDEDAKYYGQGWLRDVIIGRIPGARK